MAVDIDVYRKFLLQADPDFAKSPPEKQQAYLKSILPQSSSDIQRYYSKIAGPLTNVAAHGISAVQPALGPLADLISAGVEKGGGYQKGALRTPEARAGGLKAAQTTGARAGAEMAIPQTPEELALSLAIPGVGRLAQVLRPASKVLPSIARTAAAGASGFLDQSDPEAAALANTGIVGGLEALPGAVRLTKKLPGGRLAGKLLHMLGGASEGRSPAVHQKAAFKPGHSVYDTATGKTIDVAPEPITFHGTQGPKTVKPPTGGQLSDVILEEELQQPKKDLKQGTRTFADWLATYAKAKSQEEEAPEE
jgi:hypothetical protein